MKKISKKNERSKQKQTAQAEKSELTPLEKEAERYNRIFNIVSKCCLCVIAAAFLINWKIGVGALVFILWSWFWFDHGRFALCCDEYEVFGYPEMGMSCMIKSWVWLAVMAVAGCVIYESCV
ncbi:MAG: hypothetical protein IJ738_01270 [Alphaproteobacteria bacterium]|nr:hypothetical protein [Alphaproteobacteria bacterium]